MPEPAEEVEVKDTDLEEEEEVRAHARHWILFFLANNRFGLIPPQSLLLLPLSSYGFQEDTSLSNSDVTTKYQEAAKIANIVLEGERRKNTARACSSMMTIYSMCMHVTLLAFLWIAAVLAKAEAGASPTELCKAGDLMIEERVAKIFVKKVGIYIIMYTELSISICSDISTFLMIAARSRDVQSRKGLLFQLVCRWMNVYVIIRPWTLSLR